MYSVRLMITTQVDELRGSEVGVDRIVPEDEVLLAAKKFASVVACVVIVIVREGLVEAARNVALERFRRVHCARFESCGFKCGLP